MSCAIRELMKEILKWLGPREKDPLSLDTLKGFPGRSPDWLSIT